MNAGVMETKQDVTMAAAPRPNFFIAGSPKCGTSSLQDYLHQHPDCWLSDKIKEPGFFNRDLQINTIHRTRTEEAYLALFAKVQGKKAIGEATTWYMHSKVAAGLINEWSPASRAILMIRNPIDAAYSLHGQLLWSGNEDILDFEEAFDAQADRAAGKRIPETCRTPDALQYTAVYSYASQIERFYDAMGKDRVMVIVFEDFTKKTAEVYRRVLRFLDLDESFEATFEVKNAMKPIAPGVTKFLANKPRLRNAIRAVVPSGVQRKLIDAMPMFVKTVKRDAKLSPEARERLKPAYRADVERVSEILGRDLTDWTK